VHDDVRLINDARVEKDESHPGKVVERHWYEKNKHIFPASRWEVVRPRSPCCLRLRELLVTVASVLRAVRPERQARQVHDPRRRSQQEGIATANERWSNGHDMPVDACLHHQSLNSKAPPLAHE
jgi:hypothetical protein